MLTEHTLYGLFYRAVSPIMSKREAAKPRLCECMADYRTKKYIEMKRGSLLTEHTLYGLFYRAVSPIMSKREAAKPRLCECMADYRTKKYIEMKRGSLLTKHEKKQKGKGIKRWKRKEGRHKILCGAGDL